MVTDPERAGAYRRPATGTRRRCPAAWPRWRPSARRGAAVIDRDGEAVHSYAELGRDVSTFAAWLEARGVGAGDVVSIQLPNWYEFVVVAVATQRVGGVINPLLPDLPPQGAAPRLHRRRVRRWCARRRTIAPSTTWPPRARSSRSRGAHRPCGGGRGTTRGRRRRPTAPSSGSATSLAGAGGGDASEPGPRPAAERPGAVSELIFTSGTEAAPKAIMHTEQTANFSVRVAAQDLGIGDGDVVWMPSPIGHSTGFNYGVRFALYHGLPLVLQDRWDAGGGLRSHRAHAVPATRSPPPRSSRTWWPRPSAAASRTPRVHDAASAAAARRCRPSSCARAAACGIGVLRLYGSTEVLVATWNRPGRPGGQAPSTPTAPP